MSEDGQQEIACTECEGGYVQVSDDSRRPCPFCLGSGRREIQLYTVLTEERRLLDRWRERHARAVAQREQVKKYLNQ